MKNLGQMKTSELVAEYNAVSGKPAIAKWKRKVSELQAILLKAKPDVFFMEHTEPSGRHDTFEAPASELLTQTSRPKDHTEADVEKPKRAKAKPAATKKPAKKSSTDVERGAIRRECEELLLKTKGTDPKSKRPLGLPYAEILDKVQKKFPGAETSLNCLRWYATKMNKRTGSERVVMPTRPKSAVAA